MGLKCPKIEASWPKKVLGSSAVIIQSEMQQNHLGGKSISLHGSFLSTMHPGLNYFHEINFPKFDSSIRIKALSSTKKGQSQTINGRLKKRRFSTIIDHSQVHDTLKRNQYKLQQLKTQVDSLREHQMTDYIKKSIKCQGLLQMNDHKIKRLSSLNSKVGEVVKKSLVDPTTKQYVYNAAFIQLGIEGWKPESRQGHTCILYKEHVILIGGHCSHPFSKVGIYSLETNLWVNSFETPTARSYHTSLLYKGSYIIVFGGMGKYNASRKSRECFNTICLIDVKAGHSKMLKMTNQQQVQPRRSHSAALMGKYMVVFGGVSSKKEYLSDLVVLDLKDLRWSQKEYTIQDAGLTAFLKGGLAKHAMIPHFTKPRKYYPLYDAQYTDQEGLFFFGGTNQTGERNIVMQMTFNRYDPALKKVHCTGRVPSSVDPIVQLYNENGVVIVSGDQYQRQITIFQFKEQRFVSVGVDIGKPSLGGLGSALICYQSCYYVFYGLGEKGYIGAIGGFYINEKVEESQKQRKRLKIVSEWKRLKQNLNERGSSMSSSLHYI